VIDALLALSGEAPRGGETIRAIRFPGGEARGMAVLPPTALEGPCLVIRKLMNIAAITWEQLVSWGSVTQEVVDFLQSAVDGGVNILVAGGTASGKTTVLNRIGEMIAAEQRLVVVENFHELQIRHPRAVYLEAAGAVRVSELIHTAGLMRPDWLVFSELNGAEAMTAIEMLGKGYSGLTTIHANNLEDALARLEAMCLTANLGLGLLEIRGLIAAGIQLVCYQKRLADGRRKIVDVAELRGVEKGQYVLERLFRYAEGNGRLERTARAAWE
jgi:pilus assembly protein CpaF